MKIFKTLEIFSHCCYLCSKCLIGGQMLLPVYSVARLLVAPAMLEEMTDSESLVVF